MSTTTTDPTRKASMANNVGLGVSGGLMAASVVGDWTIPGILAAVAACALVSARRKVR